VAEEPGAEQSEGGPTEDELLEALDRVGVADVIVQALAASASIGFRRVSPEARDLPQARLAIESIRALEPVLRDCGVEDTLVRDLEQARVNLQLAYAKAVSEDSPEPAKDGV
jgi:biotin carboxylase